MKAPVLKTGRRASVSRVRIPPPPPINGCFKGVHGGKAPVCIQSCIRRSQPSRSPSFHAMLSVREPKQGRLTPYDCGRRRSWLKHEGRRELGRGQTGDIGIRLLAVALAASIAASLTGCGGGLLSSVKNPFSKEETKLPGERISAMPDSSTASICKDRIIWGPRRSIPPQAQSGPAPCTGRVQ